MLKNIILDNDVDIERLNNEEDLFKYDGKMDLSKLKSFEAVVDTREMSLTFLADIFPSLQKLRLNNSIISSVRDISSVFTHLRFLSIASCELTSLDGISAICPKIEELYLAYNNLTDVFELMNLEKLVILDLEHNKIPNIENVTLLNCCPRLRALTLIGNPCAKSKSYRNDVLEKIPQLVYLDEKRLRPKTPRSTKDLESRVVKRTNRAVNKENHNVMSSKINENTPTSKDDDNKIEELATSAEKNRNISQKSVKGLLNIKEKGEKKDIKSDSTIITPSTPASSLSLLTPEKKVVVDSSNYTKVQKGEKCGIKPKSSLSSNRVGSIITEQVEDIVNNRPPTAQGYIDPSIKKDFSVMPKIGSKKIFTPVFKRPASSFKQTRVTDKE